MPRRAKRFAGRQPDACAGNPMTATQSLLTLPTRRQGLYEITDRAAAFVREGGIDIGLLTVFVRHTSCSLLIQENADPDVRRDL